MKRQSPFLRAIAAGVIAVAALTAGAARARAQYAVFDADAALQVFHERVESYAALHRRLAPPPSSMTSTDPLSKLLTRQYLASALRSTRRYSQQGEIFSPEIATLFRKLLAPTLKGERGKDAKSVLKDDAPATVSFKINAKYPSSAPLPTVPSNLLLALPTLPKALDYRIVGKHLILRDVDADIIVDVLPNAIR